MSVRAPGAGVRERRSQVVRRRVGSISVVAAAAVVLTVAFVPLALAAVVVDVARLRTRTPLVRLLSFAWCWSWLELAGLVGAAALWVSGRAGDQERHYRLQRWWSSRLMRALERTCDVAVEVAGVDALGGPPVVVLVRHASLADSLVTAWVVADRAGLRPRVVLKRELLADPCLDVVGNRLPNCFVDRGAVDSAPSLAAIRELGASMEQTSAVIIFPEGTRSNPDKRARALDRIAERDPQRAQRLSALAHTLPPRPAGTMALLDGAAEVGATVAVGAHAGFDGLDTFRGILAALRRGPIRARLEFTVVEPPSENDPASVARWLDDRWVELDDRISSWSAADRSGSG
jgi:1-acyl-sn-glycerol-3-phosphate acyltransferase